MVPDGWKTAKISDIGTVIRGASPRPKGDPRFYGGRVPRLMVADVTRDGRYVTPTIDFLTEEGARLSRPLPAGALTLVCSGTVGIPSFLSVDACIHDGFMAIHPIKSSCDKDFLYEILRSMKQQLDSSATHGGVFTNLTTDGVKNFEFLLPPIKEQSKIAKILSTWDKSIEATERLLENSKKRKKALMQQLLTGKKRLPGFGGDWSKVTLNTVADVIVSPVDKKTIDGQPEVLLCNYMDVYRNNYITSSLEFMRATASEQEIARFSIKKGDVLITKDSESPDDIAVPALVDEDFTGVVCGYHLAIIRPKEMKLHGAYLSFLLTTPKVRHYFFTLANGATRFGLSVGAIHNAEFFLPPFNEQIQIAKVLRISDDEQTTLSKRLSHLKSEKKALMQQLLTGKKRVKVEEAA